LQAAEELPSLFRDVVVADSPLGVRVVKVAESSQAYHADLRPEDIMVRIGGSEVKSIDDFATLSSQLRGEAVSASVLIFRNGSPRELTFHLYSYPILKSWGLSFIPDHDMRFADPKAGFDYWSRMGRGFEEVGESENALKAYLNALHNTPEDSAVALKASALLLGVSRKHFDEKHLGIGLGRMQQAMQMLDRLFSQSLPTPELSRVKDQLRETLASLKKARLAVYPMTSQFPVGETLVAQTDV